jgi:hypothetical protein
VARFLEALSFARWEASALCCPRPETSSLLALAEAMAEYVRVCGVTLVAGYGMRRGDLRRVNVKMLGGRGGETDCPSRQSVDANFEAGGVEAVYC